MTSVTELVDKLTPSQRQEVLTALKKNRRSPRSRVAAEMEEILERFPSMSEKTFVAAARDAWNKYHPEGLDMVKDGSYQAFVREKMPALKAAGAKSNVEAMKDIGAMWKEERQRRRQGDDTDKANGANGADAELEDW